MRNKYFSFLFSALLACTAFPAFSAGNGDVQTRLDGYKTSVGVDGDYNKAREFLADSEAVSTAENTQAGMALEAQAKALDELARILNMDWDKDNYNSLSTVLAVRLGKDTPLAKIKAIGYKPEKFMTWLKRDENSSLLMASRTEFLNKAIRDWDTVFSPENVCEDFSPSIYSVNWGNQRQFSKEQWQDWTIKERNVIIAKIVEDVNSQVAGLGTSSWLNQCEKQCVQGKQSETDQKCVKIKTGFLKYDNIAYKDYTEGKSFDSQLLQEKASLSDNDLRKLRKGSLSDKAAVLSKIYDGRTLQDSSSADLYTKANVARKSKSSEELTPERTAMLENFLNQSGSAYSVSQSMKGTAAGDKILDYYQKNGGTLTVKIRKCENGYSERDSKDPSVIYLDSETIEEYMRAKNYTASDIMHAQQVKEIAEYMAPAVVYEGTKRIQEDSRKKAGLNNIYTSEDEAEALAMEGSFSAEKMKKDNEFASIYNKMSGYTEYASKRMQVYRDVSGKSKDRFVASVKQNYAAGLPSMDMTSAEICEAIADELQSRAGITDASEKARKEKQCENFAASVDVKNVQNTQILLEYIPNLPESYLLKLQKEFSSTSAYASRYNSSMTEIFDNIRTVSK